MDLIDAPDPGSNAPEFTVSEVSGAIRRTIEGEFAHVRVRGEVGRVSRPASGHIYLDLKDDRATLAGVVWKGAAARLAAPPEEGMEVVATGRLTTFPGQSKYQIIIDDIRPAGIGALMAMLDKRRLALAAEGLFDADRKRPLPFLPGVIGVVTSPSGAVIRDILHRLQDRFPRPVLIWPVAVQGQACAAEVARAIRGFNALVPGGVLPRPDLLIVARGGGSLEDLWGFNEEIVVRAAAESAIPLISAVGHETDTTLIDFASDRRAPTPTAAAEMAVPVRSDLIRHLDAQGARLARRAAEAVTARQQRLDDLGRALPNPRALLADRRQRLAHAGRALPRGLRATLSLRRGALERSAAAIRVPLLAARVAADRTRLDRLAGRLLPALRRSQARCAEAVGRTAGRLAAGLARVLRAQAQLAEARRGLLRDAGERLTASVARRLSRQGDRLAALDRLLLSLGHQRTLERGYAVVWGEAGLVTTAEAARAATRLEIQFRDGRMSPEPAAPQRRRKTGRPPDQGTLF